jgi:hypothetical protein
MANVLIVGLRKWGLRGPLIVPYRTVGLAAG